MASPLIRWVAVVAVVAANLPLLAGAMLALTNYAGDHEFRCSFGDNRIEIVLHHRAASDGGVAKVTGHHHTLVEQMVIGRCMSDDEPDHHFGFRRDSVLSEDDSSRVQEMADCVDFEPPAVELTAMPLPKIESPAVEGCRENFAGLSPPQVMRRGVMMRL